MEELEKCPICFDEYAAYQKLFRYLCASCTGTFVVCENCSTRMTICLYCRVNNQIAKIEDMQNSSVLLTEQLMKINRNMKKKLRQMRIVYENELKGVLINSKDNLTTAIEAYGQIKKTRDASFKVQCVTTGMGIVATILMFTPLFPLGQVLGVVKLAFDVGNVAITYKTLQNLERVIEAVLISHDRTMQNTRFSDFRSDYQILKFYLNAEDLHFGKATELRTGQNRTHTYLSAPLGIVFGLTSLGAGLGLKSGVSRATKWSANSAALNIGDFCLIGSAIESLLDCVNLYFSKKAKDLDFELYNKHIQNLEKSRKGWADLINWCDENLSEKNLEQLDKELQELAIQHSKDTSIPKTIQLLQSLEQEQESEIQKKITNEEKIVDPNVVE